MAPRTIVQGAICLLIATACGAQQVKPSTSSSLASTSNFLTYRDAKDGFSIRYPATWTLRSGDMFSVAFLSPRESLTDDFQENVNVLVQELPPTTTLEQYTESSIRQGKTQIDGFTLISVASTTVDNRPTKRVFFSGKAESHNLMWEAVWMVDAGKAFVLTYTGERDSFSRYLGLAEAIMFSFQLPSAP